MEQNQNMSLGFAVKSVAINFISWAIVSNLIRLSINFQTYAQFTIIDGTIRGFFAIPAILVLGKITQSSGLKLTFTIKGFKKGIFAHTIMLLPLLAIPFILISIPEAQLSFNNVTPWLLPMVIFDIGNAVWEEALWRGVLMSGILIKWSSTWETPGTVNKRIIFMLVCSVAFGTVHFSGGLLHIAYAAIMGTVFSSAYIYSKNLLACITVHAILNYIFRTVFFMFYDTDIGMMFFERVLIVNIFSGIAVIPFAIYLTAKAEAFSLNLPSENTD